MSGAAAPRATIVDTGIGNLGNLERAVRSLGVPVATSLDPGLIADSPCLLLPGVGAFRPPRERLRGALEEALRAALARGAWVLGICVGYQLLFESGEEFGTTDGLALLPGSVASLPASVSLPHIGWNRLHVRQAGHRLMRGLADRSYLYFVHSFAPRRVPAEMVVASCLHGVDFPAVVARDRVMGTQFHPEKSGAAGLRVLANYLSLALGDLDGTAAGN
ncbi:MAG: imidazole glycerol phosphate synthase subunit HisH [Acidobacteriota bacterium]